MGSLNKLDVSTFPREMCSVPLWLNYKLVDRGDGKFGKPPVSPITGEICSKTDEGKYVDFDRALLGMEMHDLDGVGFVFMHGFVAIDLDNCFDDDGNLTEFAADIFDHFSATYAEFSPSGNGIHIFCQGEKPNNRTRIDGLEVYSGQNFVTVTGNRIPESGDQVLHMQDQLNWLFDKYLPVTEAPVVVKPEVISVDHGDKTPMEWLEHGLAHDDKFNRLYTDTAHIDDESGHDLSLLLKLMFWLNKDINEVEEAFYGSPWVQSKDIAHQNKIIKRGDYIERSMDKAYAMTATTAVEQDNKFRNLAEIKLRIAHTADGEVVIPLADFTDVGNAKAFVEMYSHDLAYTQEWGWCHYDGVSWEVGQPYRARQCAVEFGDSVMYIAKETQEYYVNKCREMNLNPSSKEGREVMAPAVALMKHATRTQSAAGIRSMLEIAEGMMLKPSSAFDSNPWELNTPNVVVDLRTGETYPPTWNHYNTKVTGLSYDPNVECSGMWDDFLNTIFCGDRALIDYVQVYLGAACVGKVYEENLLIANGGGSNGKSTLFGLLYSVLGDYAMSVNPDILLGKPSNEQQIAAAELKGKRLCIAQETESGQKMSSAKLKRLVSTDNIVARKIYHDPMEFTPTHSLVLSTNHLPEIEDGDKGTWRRITVIPFNATIEGDAIITNFKDVLMDQDGTYIMKWLVQGAMKFYENGCTYGKKPYACLEASNDYKRSQRDSIDVFVEDCVQTIGFNPNFSGVWSKPDEVYGRYVKWCTENGITKPASKIALSKSLQERGMKVEKRYRKGLGTIRIWRDIVLYNEDGSERLIVK